MAIAVTWVTRIRATKATVTTPALTRTILILAIAIAKGLVAIITTIAKAAVLIIATTIRTAAIQECPSKIIVIAATTTIITTVMDRRITPTVR